MRLAQPHGGCQFGSDVLNRTPHITSGDLTVFHDLFHTRPGHIARHGEPNSEIAAARTQYRGVQTDQLASRIDQRASGVTGIDRSVGLDEVLVVLNAKPAAPSGADN